MYQRVVKQARKTYWQTVTCKPLLGIKNSKVCRSLYSFTQGDSSPERRTLCACTSQRKVFIVLRNIIVSAMRRTRAYASDGLGLQWWFAKTEEYDKKSCHLQKGSWRAVTGEQRDGG